MRFKRYHILVPILVLVSGVYFARQIQVEVHPAGVAHAEVKSYEAAETRKKVSAGQLIPVNLPAKTKEPSAGHLLTSAAFEMQAYCRIKNANVGIPLDGDLKIVAFPFDSDETGSSGFIALVQSKNCPENGYSKVIVDSLGRGSSVLDCQRDRPIEISLNSGVQGTILDAPSRGHQINLAISGEGFFVTDCPTGIVLQRTGDFEFRDGRLWRGECHVLDRRGEPFNSETSDLDNDGCTNDGSCLAIASAKVPEAEIIDRTTIRTGDSFPPLLASGIVFSNALEDFSDPQVGPFGPNWNRVPRFERPVHCD